MRNIAEEPESKPSSSEALTVAHASTQQQGQDQGTSTILFFFFFYLLWPSSFTPNCHSPFGGLSLLPGIQRGCSVVILKPYFTEPLPKTEKAGEYKKSGSRPVPLHPRPHHLFIQHYRLILTGFSIKNPSQLGFFLFNESFEVTEI